VSTRAKILAAVAVLGVLVILLAQGEEPSSRVQALREDPMARYAPSGGTLVRTESRNEGRSLGEPVPATYTRLFRLDADTDAARALEAARSAARAAGWERLGEAAGETFVGSKHVPSGRIALTLVLVEDPNLLPEGVEPPALSVGLRHLGG
jgi:hypothetical protein